MSQIAQLKEELQGTKTIKFIAKVFTEVNAIKARNIRQGFENNRRFYKEISAVYHSVRLSESSKKGNQYNEKKNVKEVAIALTSNLRFYGSLNLDVMERFIADVSGSGKKDLIIIGQTGLDYLEARNLNLEVQPLRFKKDYPSPEEVNFLVEKTNEYSRVDLYYPKFINMISQKVDVLDITQTPEVSETDQPTADLTQTIEIFEPEMDKIVEFFEHQVRTLLLIRTVLETELSRTAARLLAMSASEQRADAVIKTTRSQINKISNSLENAKILETFAGMKNWQKFVN